jgi:hypothetical protein
LPEIARRKPNPRWDPLSLNPGRWIENQMPRLVHLSEPVPADLDRIDHFKSKGPYPWSEWTGTLQSYCTTWPTSVQNRIQK